MSDFFSPARLTKLAVWNVDILHRLSSVCLDEPQWGRFGPVTRCDEHILYVMMPKQTRTKTTAEPTEEQARMESGSTANLLPVRTEATKLMLQNRGQPREREREGGCDMWNLKQLGQNRFCCWLLGRCRPTVQLLYTERVIQMCFQLHHVGDHVRTICRSWRLGKQNCQLWSHLLVY